MRTRTMRYRTKEAVRTGDFVKVSEAKAREAGVGRFGTVTTYCNEFVTVSHSGAKVDWLRSDLKFISRSAT